MQTIENVILNRRHISPAKMNGKKISDNLIRNLLALAHWAPTHKLTEPWHFTVFSEENVAVFCRDHAEMYKRCTPTDSFKQSKYEKLLQRTQASHIIGITVKIRGKLPEEEEIAAVGCAVENLWLAATAHQIVGYWTTGGMVYHPAMREYLQLKSSDKPLGFLYLGYIDGNQPQGKRSKPIDEKIRWI